MSIWRPLIWFLKDVLEACALMLERYHRMYLQHKKITLDTRILTADLAQRVNSRIGALLPNNTTLESLAKGTCSRWFDFWNSQVLTSNEHVQVGLVISRLYLYQAETGITNLSKLRTASRDDLIAAGLGNKGNTWVLEAFKALQI